MTTSMCSVLNLVFFVSSVGDIVEIDAASFSPDSSIFGYVERTLHTTMPFPHASIYRQTVEFVWCGTNSPTKRSRVRVEDIGKGHPSSALVDSTVFRFSPDSQKVLTLSPNGLRIVELMSGKSAVLLNANQRPRCAAWLSSHQLGAVRLSSSVPPKKEQLVKIVVSGDSPIITKLFESDLGSLPEVTWSPDGTWALIHPSSKHGWQLVNSRNLKSWTIGTPCGAGSVAIWSPDGMEALCIDANLFCESWKCRRVNVSTRQEDDLTSQLKDLGLSASLLGVCCRSEGVDCRDTDRKPGAIWLKDGRRLLLGKIGGLLDLKTTQLITIDRDGHRKTGLEFAKELYPTSVEGWYLAKRTTGGTEYVLVNASFEIVKPLTEFSTEWRYYFSSGSRPGLFSPNGLFAACLTPDQSHVTIKKLNPPLTTSTNRGN